MMIHVFSILMSFLVTLISTPRIGKFLKDIGVVSVDLHKKNKPVLPSSGGICVAVGVVLGLFLYLGLLTFLYGEKNIEILAVICSVLLVTAVGFADDLSVKKRLQRTKDGMNLKVGLPQRKWLLTLPAAIPLMVVAAGDTTMNLPFIGSFDFGLLYPLVLVPFGFVCASNAVNLLGGFNGSEAGMGIVYMTSLGIYGLMHGSLGSIIFLTCAASLLGFIVYNKYPAKILPGDSLTYLLGSTVAGGVIIGNMERAGVIVLIPFIIEFFLKLRSGFKATSLGKIGRNGYLIPPYGKKIYSITHIIMNLKKVREKDVTCLLILLSLLFSVLIFFV